MSTGYRLQRSLPPEQRILQGTPGSIYLLENSGLREQIFRLGATRRSGVAKAMELNRDQHTLIPGQYECVFELHAKDCGTALEIIRERLRQFRCNQRNPDFYQLDLDYAVDVISSVIAETNSTLLQRAAVTEYPPRHQMRHLEPDLVTEPAAAFSAPQPGLFKKAMAWMAN